MKYLRLITIDDLDTIRCWKNANKKAFFHKEDISVEQQQEWFRQYNNKISNYMFMVEVEGRKIGCMGIRYIGGALRTWDIYNVILGLPEYKGTGTMSAALKELIEFVTHQNIGPIAVKVLKSNDALYWYEKNGFYIAGNFLDHYYMVCRGVL